MPLYNMADIQYPILQNRPFPEAEQGGAGSMNAVPANPAQMIAGGVGGAVSGALTEMLETACDITTAPVNIAQGMSNNNVHQVIEGVGAVAKGVSIGLLPDQAVRSLGGPAVVGAIEGAGGHVNSRIKDIVVGNRDCIKGHFDMAADSSQAMHAQVNEINYAGLDKFPPAPEGSPPVTPQFTPNGGLF